MSQKFDRGDLVQVADDLGSGMSHFTSGCRAVVMGSYYEQYGGGKREKNIYTLYLEGDGQSSWYYDHQLTLIAKDQMGLVKKWKKEAKAEDKKHSDLDWIFSHGDEVLKHGYAVSAAALVGKSVGYLWGPSGEGITLYSNIVGVLKAAKPFLLSGDKAGWENLMKEKKNLE